MYMPYIYIYYTSVTDIQTLPINKPRLKPTDNWQIAHDTCGRTVTATVDMHCFIYSTCYMLGFAIGFLTA